MANSYEKAFMKKFKISQPIRAHGDQLRFRITLNSSKTSSEPLEEYFLIDNLASSYAEALGKRSEISQQIRGNGGHIGFRSEKQQHFLRAHTGTCLAGMTSSLSNDVVLGKVENVSINQSPIALKSFKTSSESQEEHFWEVW